MWLSLPNNNHQSHQCDYLSHFDINDKGPFSSWGRSPRLNAFDIPLNNLSIFEQGISLWCNAENTSLILPLWPSLLLELCLCALSSNIGLFSRYASDKYLLLESWEEEWLPLWACIPYIFCKMNIVLPYNDPWTYSCIKLMPYQASWNKRYVNNEIKNHKQNINQAHPVQKCVLIMHNTYVHQHHAMCQKISSMECINHMPLSICQHVHLPICQPCASTNIPTMCHITHDMSPSWTKYHNHVSNKYQIFVLLK